jgi:predicted nucleic acid-binding protein
VYLDSAILVKLVVREPDSDFYVDMVDGQRAVCSSELAMAECRSALLRKSREGHLSASTCGAAWKRLQAYWEEGGGLALQPVSRAVLIKASETMEFCMARVPLRTLDAIHIASCLISRAYPLVTNDAVMRAAARLLDVPLGAVAEESGRGPSR